MPHSELADHELLERWRGGDQRAGARLVERYYDLLIRFFRNKVRDAEDATDLVSETMLGCTRGHQSIENQGAFRSYVFAIAMNTLRAYLRKKTKRARELDDFSELCVAQTLGGDSPTRMIARREEAQLLARALRRIPIEQQIVLELDFVEGLDPAAIAELLGVPVDTVYTRRRRGRTRLREAIEALTEDEALAQSTVVGLETWAGQIRAGLTPAPKSS
ncbi:MAG: sigma-70 family RNA polymerase sigma factor [Myxococcota bacterium]